MAVQQDAAPSVIGQTGKGLRRSLFGDRGNGSAPCRLAIAASSNTPPAPPDHGCVATECAPSGPRPHRSNQNRSSRGVAPTGRRAGVVGSPFSIPARGPGMFSCQLSRRPTSQANLGAFLEPGPRAGHVWASFSSPAHGPGMFSCQLSGRPAGRASFCSFFEPSPPAWLVRATFLSPAHRPAMFGRPFRTRAADRRSQRSCFQTVPPETPRPPTRSTQFDGLSLPTSSPGFSSRN